MEEFIGKPYVYTINKNNESEIRETFKEIMKNFQENKVRESHPRARI